MMGQRAAAIHTLTARRLAGGDLEGLGGQADRALDGKVLLLGTVDQVAAHYAHSKRQAVRVLARESEGAGEIHDSRISNEAV